MTFDGFRNLPYGLIYSTIVIDPPWKYGDDLPGKKRGASKHYRTLTDEQIAELPVRSLADDNSHLWLWVTNSFIRTGLDLMEHWGFEYKTKLTWVKAPGIGMGRYLRNTTEDCLLGVRGRLPNQGPKNIPSHVIAPKTAHSVKPEVAYNVIRAISPAPRLEMFARAERRGFDVWGDQAPSVLDKSEP